MNNQIQIKDLLNLDSEGLDGLRKDLDFFLGEFNDPPGETMECLFIAKQSGFIFEAIDSDKNRLGIVVITPTFFQKFQPHFHLAYIATHPDCRGKGVGKLLLDEALKRTEGNLALHVEPNNKSAIGFYEKQGWKIKYVRMLPA